jgi:hypothetical protein
LQRPAARERRAVGTENDEPAVAGPQPADDERRTDAERIAPIGLVDLELRRATGDARIRSEDDRPTGRRVDELCRAAAEPVSAVRREGADRLDDAIRKPNPDGRGERPGPGIESGPDDPLARPGERVRPDSIREREHGTERG